MEVLHVKKYNEKKQAKYREDLNKAIADGRGVGEMPQLIFYIFLKNYGYVASDGKKSLWNKTKKGVIAWWEDEERLRKVRGY